MFEAIAMNNLSASGDEKVVEVGEKYLDTGAALLQRDSSGRLAMSQGVDHLKANIFNSDFSRGLDVAKTVYDECFSALK
jgi:hypothetical protein